MSPFHSGMNHWQRKWLSNRLHKKTAAQSHSASVRERSQPAVTPTIDESISVKAQVLQKRKVSPSRPPKISWPATDVLTKLLWEKPTSQIAKDLGVSDKAVEKHCKKLGLNKPPRGHWAKIAAGHGDK